MSVNMKVELFALGPELHNFLVLQVQEQVSCLEKTPRMSLMTFFHGAEGPATGSLAEEEPGQIPHPLRELWRLLPLPTLWLKLVGPASALLPFLDFCTISNDAKLSTHSLRQ